MTPGDGFFADIVGGADPAQLREAGDLAATVLVRGARESGDPELAERVVHLADTEGLAAGTVDEMKRDRVLGKMSAQEAFRRHLERG